MDGTYTKFENNVRTVHTTDDEKGFEIHVENTVVFVRGTPERDSWLDLVSQLEKAGYCVVNSRDCMELAGDKYRTYLRLQDFGLTQPKTVLIPNEDGIETSFKNLDTKFPIIMKTLRGSKGVGVLFIESERGLNSLVQLLFKQDSQADLLIQEYKKTKFDVRVLVLGGKIIATMQRDVLEGDFRSNYSQGAKVKTYDLSELEIEQCLLAAKAIGGLFTAVDFIPSENTKKDPPYILEVNSSPGTEGIEEANKKNIVKEVIKYFDNPDFRYTVPTECGWEEVVTIKPFGQLSAKFDTGNYKFSVLHAENIEINGNKITFTLGDKTITTKLIGKYVSVTGGGEDERPIVELGFEFSGSNYSKIPFGLDDRTKMGTDVLMNRKMMKMLNVMVNPQRKYIVTTKYVLDK
tara:strand:- start:17 stop:1231 length:1215 start_codon:yes stop_codon:yes gene_type:complete